MSFHDMLFEDARLASDRKDWHVAVALWRRLLAEDGHKNGTVAYLKLISAMDALGDTKEVERLIHEALEKYPHSALLMCQRGRFHSRRNEWSSALLALEAAVAIKSDVPEWAHRLLIQCHTRLGRIGDAIRAAELAVSMRPNSERLRSEQALAAAAPTAMKNLKKSLLSLAGGPCIVFGSAPEPDFGPKGFRGERIVCCNGSARSLQDRFALSPDYSIIHSHVFARETDSDREVREALSGTKNIGTQIVLTSSIHPVTHEVPVAFDWSHRFHVVTQLLDAPVPYLDFSTGAFAVLAALYAGASEVRLVGFSFNSKGHSYNRNDRYRNHVASDAALYALLTARGFKIDAEAPEIATICRARID